MTSSLKEPNFWIGTLVGAVVALAGATAARIFDLGLIPVQEITKKNSEYAAEVLRRPAGSLEEAKTRVETLTRLQGGVFDWLDAMKACLAYAKLDLKRLEHQAEEGQKTRALAAEVAASAASSVAATAAASAAEQRQAQELAVQLAEAQQRARDATAAYEDRARSERIQRIMDRNPNSR